MKCSIVDINMSTILCLVLNHKRSEITKHGYKQNVRTAKSWCPEERCWGGDHNRGGFLHKRLDIGDAAGDPHAGDIIDLCLNLMWKRVSPNASISHLLL